VPDASGEVALEAADGFGAALAFGSFALDIRLGFGVASGASDRDAMMAVLVWRLPPRSRR
jgi:hypothetical protein